MMGVAPHGVVAGGVVSEPEDPESRVFETGSHPLATESQASANAGMMELCLLMPRSSSYVAQSVSMPPQKQSQPSFLLR